MTGFLCTVAYVALVVLCAAVPLGHTARPRRRPRSNR